MGRVSILGELEQIVLMAVLRLDDAYPVAVRDEIKGVAGVELSRGTVYVTLHRLEDKGLVTSAFGDATPARGGKPKRCFTVTRTGKQALRDSQSVLRALGDGIEARLRR